jgi:DNA-binding protein H-NS
MTENYKYQLEEGKEFEKYVKKQLQEKKQLHLDIIEDEVNQYTIGETIQGYEIKYDKKYKDTGNLYIEIKEKTNPNNAKFVLSGIFRQDNTHTWIIGNYDEVYMFKKDTLIEIYNKQEYVRYVKTLTSHGVLLNKALIDKHNIEHIYFEKKPNK